MMIYRLSFCRARQWNIHSDYGCLNNYAVPCDFYISFCQTGEIYQFLIIVQNIIKFLSVSLAPACFNEYSACQNVSSTSNVTVIGTYSSSVFFDYGT